MRRKNSFRQVLPQRGDVVGSAYMKAGALWLSSNHLALLKTSSIDLYRPLPTPTDPAHRTPTDPAQKLSRTKKHLVPMYWVRSNRGPDVVLIALAGLGASPQCLAVHRSTAAMAACRDAVGVNDHQEET
jgi:hypothetical protein